MLMKPVGDQSLTGRRLISDFCNQSPIESVADSLFRMLEKIDLDLRPLGDVAERSRVAIASSMGRGL